MSIRIDTTEKDHESRAALVADLTKKFQQSSDLPLYDINISPGHYSEGFLPEQEKDADLVVYVDNESKSPQQASLRPWAPVLDVQPGHAGPSAASEFIFHEIVRAYADEQRSLSHLMSDSPFVSDKGIALTADQKTKLDARTTRAFKYASMYHLTFSLFSASATPSAWDIDVAMQQYLSPLLRQLSNVSRFTVDTQVQLHAAFSPSIAGPQFDQASGKWHLQKTDLSGFVNAAEWPLNPSIGAGPTINFVLYVPTKDQSPLEIAETGGTSWLIPQWGGVQIYNPSNKQDSALSADDLEAVMLTFADQLTALVGLPPSPPSLTLRLASMTRERTTSLILSASSTLGALSRLTLKLTSIAIPNSVAKSVDETIARLEQACLDLREGRYNNALANARIANDEAEKAFFEPSMVGQVYFPDEHKVAVYVPLLGPVAVPLVMAAVKELLSLRRRKVKST